MTNVGPRRYVALLRAINLGARNRVPMARLREVCEQVGCTDVKTYIASGNVVLSSTYSAAELRRKLEGAIEAEFGFAIAVVVVTAQQLAAVIKRNPFPDAQPGALHVAFATDRIGKPDVNRLRDFDFGQEQGHVDGSVIYLHLPEGYGRSGLAAEVSKVKLPTTVRTWRTIAALAELAASKS